jgi:biopolymer transport protein ExbD
MNEMNTTPLIDVMLVLLIMFIITIPVQSHSVPIDLPAPTDIVVQRERNKVAIADSGAVLWNGAPITLTDLRSTLDRLATMRPQPELQFEPHPEARYQVVDEVLAVMKRANVTAMGMVGNERYADF